MLCTTPSRRHILLAGRAQILSTQERPEASPDKSSATARQRLTLIEGRLMSKPSPQALYFDSFSIATDVDLLYQGDRVLPLEPRAVRVLRYLAQHAGRVIAKEELLEAVWPDVFTT